MLRSNNGGEYNNNVFNVYCPKYGIKRQLMIPCTLQQNGVVKRKNMIIMEMARCILGNISSFLWGEVVSIAI